MDPALASLLETLQGKLRDIVSKSATFAATTTDEEGTYTSDLEDAKRAILTCEKKASECFLKERARMLASMSADDKKEWSSILDDDGAFYRVLVLKAKEKLNRAVETRDQKPST